MPVYKEVLQLFSATNHSTFHAIFLSPEFPSFDTRSLHFVGGKVCHGNLEFFSTPVHAVLMRTLEYELM